MKKPALVFVTALLCTLLAACSLPQAPQTQLHYLLAAKRHGPALTASYDTLRLVPLRAAAPYDSPYFVYRETEQRYIVDPYRGFILPPAQQISERMRDWLGISGLARHVVGPGPMPVQVRLEGELTRFDVDLRPGQPPAVTVALRLRLEDEASQTLLLDQTFTTNERLSVVTPDGIAAAFDSATAQLLSEVELALQSHH